MPLTLTLRDTLFIIVSIVYCSLGLIWGTPPLNILVNWSIWFLGARLFFYWLHISNALHRIDALLWQIGTLFTIRLLPVNIGPMNTENKIRLLIVIMTAVILIILYFNLPRSW